VLCPGGVIISTFSLNRRIDAPIEAVFEVATDLPRAAQHIRGIERIELLTDLPSSPALT